MKRTAVLFVLTVLAGGWLVVDLIRHPSPAPDRGVEGVEFVVPAGYIVLDLGETTRRSAAARLLQVLEQTDRVAARFTEAGDRVQLLADGTEGTLDEQVLGKHGTAESVLWRGGVRERLQWAEAEGTFQAPGLPDPVRRNPYH